ncbi:enoyl-CoA hydratase/isomerase family protein [Gordonia hydrophobica]|uniref:Enoyl-CoA hydratase/isomerase family protein n=1 Tax=Gordonia hydrophobica TaxID=40516 RepID=A0ABZ2U694_9ACTN|nr:enoyl-CoA hydratase/isomerase family protein [Gordonia hydrophobica]MBM7365657.1 enoyl-CoA hydratase [Gordonia hydrophobica]
MQFDSYQRLLFERRENGVLLITINRPEKHNAADSAMLAEFTRVWKDVAADEATRAVVITGAGRAFSAGGDLSEEIDKLDDFPSVVKTLEEARGLVAGMVECDKPVVSAINGAAAGAGLAIALLSDISIIGEDVAFTDGHVKIGLAAGDHSVIIWPLLCGMAKAKYLLLTADRIDGREAERIGLVSKAVPREEVLTEALRIADQLARSPRYAVQWTKHALNNWLRLAMPSFEASLGLEMLTFFSPDAKEGMSAFLERRHAQFE